MASLEAELIWINERFILSRVFICQQFVTLHTALQWRVCVELHVLPRLTLHSARTLAKRQ